MTTIIYRDKDGDIWESGENGTIFCIASDPDALIPGDLRLIEEVEDRWGPLIPFRGPLTEEQLKPQLADIGQRIEYGTAGRGFVDSVIMNAPKSWDGDEAIKHIALSYVATLEARLDAAGISREKWVEAPR